MMRMTQTRSCLQVAALVLACLTLAAAPAMADIVGGALTIRAINAEGDEATFVIEAPSHAQSWTWTSSQTIEMRSPTTGNVVAIINPNGDETMVEYIDDPVITLNFSVQAGGSTTTFIIGSALLSFPALTAEGRATVGMSVTDSDGDGVTMTGTGDPAGAQGAYLAQYNGYAGTLSGTTFAEVIQGISAAGFSSNTATGQVPAGPGFQSIAAPVGDMSVRVSFSLTANDQASGTSTYVIQQRPLPVASTTWSGIKALLH